jgi:hypothetical protein
VPGFVVVVVVVIGTLIVVVGTLIIVVPGVGVVVVVGTLIIVVETLIIFVLGLLPTVFLAYICISYTLPELNPDNSKYCGSSSKPIKLRQEVFHDVVFDNRYSNTNVWSTPPSKPATQRISIFVA